MDVTASVASLGNQRNLHSPLSNSFRKGAANEIAYHLIGVIRSEHVCPDKTPIQSVYASGCRGRAEILPEYTEGLCDLEGFSYIYLIYDFHRAGAVKLNVKPFLQDVERGVFATRAPCRPNSIGISIVKLLFRQDNILYLDWVDILDGTPLLDIKPYVARFDRIEHTRDGWHDGVDEETARHRGKRGYSAKESVMAKTHLQNNLSFRLMSLEYRLRDRVRPPLQVLQEIGVKPGMAVLDFGCGPGGFSLAAARLIGSAGQVYAADIHPLAIKSVQRAARRDNITNVQAILGSNVAELSRGSIDIILLYDVLHHIPEPGLMLTKFHQLLKPKRVLSVRDHRLSEALLLASVTGGGLFRLVGRNRWAFQFERTETNESAT